MDSTDNIEYWCVVANIKHEIPYGEKKELRNGTKHFSGKSKVIIIDWFPGPATHVVVIGQHRVSRRHIIVTMCVDAIENFRAKQIFKPKYLELLKGYQCKKCVSFNKERAEHVAAELPQWQQNLINLKNEKPT